MKNVLLALKKTNFTKIIGQKDFDSKNLRERSWFMYLLI